MKSIMAGLLWIAAFTPFGANQREEEVLHGPISISDNGPAVAAQYKSEVAEAERLGRIIYEHDLAAARATDFIFEKTKGQMNPDAVGWIEESLPDGGFRVYFFGMTDESEYFPVYSVDIVGGEAIGDSFKSYEDKTAFGTPLNNLAKARMLALKQPFAPCRQNYNTVAFENAPGQYFVYLLPGTFDPEEILIGGNYRYLVDLERGGVIGFQKFTNTCFVMRKPNLKKGDVLAAMMMTQIVTPYPTEIHVFLSIQHQLDFFVITADSEGNRVAWKVSKGEISLADFAA